MSQHSSPDVLPIRDSQAGAAPATQQNNLSDTFFAGWCEARRYTVQEVIGKGSYGVVCAAIDNFTKERVAIKKIMGVFDNVSDATRILREIKLLRLLKHPDVVEIKHIMLPPDPRTFKDIYVVFELLESDLHTVIGANDDLTSDHHKVFLYQLLRGLNFIHSSGVLHRDLKPKNILANSNCKLKICDFGLARPFLSDTHVSPVHWTDYVATRWYRAPELCGCFYGRYSPAVDIWSIGCIFAEVLLGKPLFPGRDAVSQLQLITDLLGKPPVHTIERIGNQKARAFLHGLPPKPPRPFEQKFPNASPAALNLLRRLLAFDPADRPTAAEALADPYFANLPNATVQEPAAYSRHQFDFEHRKLDTAEVRALIYQEALAYHPAVAAYHAQQQALAQTMYSPLTVPGGDIDMRRQFRLAEQQQQAQQQPAATAMVPASMVSHSTAAGVHPGMMGAMPVSHAGVGHAGVGVGANMLMPQQQIAPSISAAGSDYSTMTAGNGAALAAWYKQQQLAHMGAQYVGTDMMLTAEQQAMALMNYQHQQQRLAAMQAMQAMGH